MMMMLDCNPFSVLALSLLIAIKEEVVDYVVLEYFEVLRKYYSEDATRRDTVNALHVYPQNIILYG